MKNLLLTTIAVLMLLGCGESQQLAPAPESKPVAKVAKPESPTAKTPDISIHRAALDGAGYHIGPVQLQGLDQLIKDDVARGAKTILIPEGVYTVSGAILLGKEFSGTRLVAENDNVKIVSSQSGPVFFISNVSDFELSGFTFKSTTPEDPESPIGFHYLGSEDGDWTSGSSAIYIEDSTRIKVSGNYISGYWMGIFITPNEKMVSYVDVVGNTVTDCGYWSIAARDLNQPGNTHQDYVDGTTTGELDLRHITFRENLVSKCEQGPLFRNVSHGVMDQNIVFSNIIGIRIELSRFCIIKNNDVSKNLQSGIWIYNHSHHNHITGNRIYDNNLQAERIIKIAKERGQDEDFLPGDIERYYSHPKKYFNEIAILLGNVNRMLAYEPDYWRYPTAYDFITPSNRMENHLDPELNEKFWGIYFSQLGVSGIELRSDASHNLIDRNKIFNSSPVNMSKGYTMYGVKIMHLANTNDFDSKFNVIRDNHINNMVGSPIFNVNQKHGVKGENVVK